MPAVVAPESAQLPPESLEDALHGAFDHVLALIPAGVYACDRDGIIVRYNSRAAELWGRAPRLGDPEQRFCGSVRMYRLDGGPLPHGECPTAEVLKTGRPVRGQEIVIERPDGSRAVALVNVEPLYDRHGTVLGAINCFQDITDAKRVEAALHEAQRRSMDLVSALPAALYTTDAEGRLTFFNEAAATLWGHRPALGTTLWCGSWRLLWPDGQPMPHDECPMAVALKEGRAIAGAEAIAVRPDGTRVPFLAYPTPLRDAAGAIVGAMNMLIDISGRTQTERSAQMLASIVASSDDAIVSKDLNGIIATWNEGAEELFGYSAEEAIGQPIMMLIPPGRHDEEPEILDRIRRGERIEHYETVRRRKDGSLVDISLTVSPIFNAHGRVIGASKIARDITERKQVEEQRRLLLREMNHRVKNLFALASGVVAISARHAELAEAMATAVRRRLGALSLAHELTLPHADAEDEIAPATTLRLLLETLVEPYIEDGRDRVSLEGPDVTIGSHAITTLALLFHEIATNAAKYGALMPEGGNVAIKWSVDNDAVSLEWRESEGAEVEGAPETSGFGTFLANATITQLGGRIERVWQREGLIVRLTLPLDRLER